MTAKLLIYPHGLTGHIAWQLNDAHFSFHPGEKIADLGLMDLPLPGGIRKSRVSAHVRQLRCKEHDEATYKADQRPASVVQLPGLHAAAAAAFIRNFLQADLPYILWDKEHDIGAINCVTTSLMTFSVALPQHWPSDWDLKWGDSFKQLRTLAKNGADWVEEVIRHPLPRLMQVSQFHEMATDWANAFAAETKSPLD